MVQDALDPGPDGNYPAWPRKADGTPDPERMPTGLHSQKVPGTRERVVVDVTLRDDEGNPIIPPTLPPT